jgi:hypothetical protein
MPWVRLDEAFATDPKVVEAGPLALAMQVAGLCYCNRHLTDGRIPKPIASMLLDFSGLGMRMWHGELMGAGEDASWELVVGDLIGAGMWHEPGHDCGDCPEIESGYVIHDYLEYQPSKAQVLENREKKSRAGRMGGQASAKARAQAPASPLAIPPAQADFNPVPVSDTDKAAASNGFVAFNARRAVEATRERKRRGLPVKSESGLAKTIQADPEHVAESQRLWGHRDCPKCRGKGVVGVYSPGAGMRSVVCGEGVG